MGIYVWKEICEAFCQRALPNLHSSGRQKATGLLARDVSAKRADQLENQGGNPKWRELQNRWTPESTHKLHPNPWPTAKLCLCKENHIESNKKAAARNWKNWAESVAAAHCKGDSAWSSNTPMLTIRQNKNQHTSEYNRIQYPYHVPFSGQCMLKNDQTRKEIVKCDQTQEKAINRNQSWGDPNAAIRTQDFKALIINILKEDGNVS